MAIKTFAAGNILTASDTNTYLANSGLVYVASGALSTATTDFVGCFTSDYRDYRIVIDSLQTNANADLYYRMLSSTTPDTTANYFWAQPGYNTVGTTIAGSGASQNKGYVGFTQIAAPNTPIGSATIDIFGPQLAQRTFLQCQSVSYDSGNFVSRTGMSMHNVLSAFTGIRFLSDSASTFGGNVTIYGYRKA